MERLVFIKRKILTFFVEFVQFDEQPSLLIGFKTVSEFIVLGSQEHTDGGVLGCSRIVFNIDDV